MSEEAHLTNLMEEIENIKWHIIGLGEVRRNGELLMNIKGHLLYHKGRDDIKQCGVGFLVNKEITKRTSKNSMANLTE